MYRVFIYVAEKKSSLNIMKILYIIAGNGSGYGSEQVALSIINGLTNKGFQFVVISAHRGYVSRYLDERNIENYIVNFMFYAHRKMKNPIVNTIKRRIKKGLADIYDFRAMRKISDIIDINDIGLIHSNLSRTMVGARLARKYRIPHIWHIQELFTGHYRDVPIKLNQIEWMNKYADKIITISNAVSDGWIRAGINKDKMVTIYNGINIDSVSRKEYYSHINDDLKIVMVGMICEEKGQDILIEAVSALAKEKKNIIIDFFGDGNPLYIKSLKERCQQQGVNAYFKGYNDNIKQILKNYDIGVNCSKGEGFGLATLEYMAVGLCVIASNTGANTELIDCNETGYVFNRKDSKQLSEIIYTVFHDRQLINVHGVKARERAINCFNDQIFLRKITDVYTEYITKSGSCHHQT